jgi:hypothetical protein
VHVPGVSDDPGDWMQVSVAAPPEVGESVLKFLEREFGYRHVPNGIDWCVWEREEDFSQVTTAPCEPITKNAYVVDWRKGQGRGDVPVIIELPEDRC